MDGYREDARKSTYVFLTATEYKVDMQIAAGFGMRSSKGFELSLAAKPYNPIPFIWIKPYMNYNATRSFVWLLI